MPDTFRNPDAAAIRALLQSVRTIAVVGLSPNPLRPSPVSYTHLTLPTRDLLKI